MLARTFRVPKHPYSRKFNIARWIILGLALLLFAGTGLIGYAYQTISVPKPEDLSTNQFYTI